MKIALFYKRLFHLGGAERLLFREYAYLKEKKYHVKIICFKAKQFEFMKENINPNDLVIIGDNIFSILKLRLFLNRNKFDHILCASGHVDLFFAILFSNHKYSLHLHHPISMWLDDTDKYSIFKLRQFENMLHSNYGSKVFLNEKKNLSLLILIYSSLRERLSSKSIMRAEKTFVFSQYAKAEKLAFYGVESIVTKGAIEKVNRKIIFERKYSENKKVLLVSRLDPNKRIDIVIKSLLYLSKDITLTIVGDGDERMSLKDLVYELSLSERVHFEGFVSEHELKTHYLSHDVFISIDWSDYRLTMFEALNHGCAVISSIETDLGVDQLPFGYMYFCEPNPIEAAIAIKLAFQDTVTRRPNELTKFLEEYTWNNYCDFVFKHISA